MLGFVVRGLEFTILMFGGEHAARGGTNALYALVAACLKESVAWG